LQGTYAVSTGATFDNWANLVQSAADVKFVDAANRDYRLQADSPAVGMGYEAEAA